jgi:hypothetical protein
MDDHVEVPEAVVDGVEKGSYRLLVGDVRRECRTAPTLVLNLADRRVGQVDVTGIRDRDVKAVGGQISGDNPPHASGSTRHQGGPYAAFDGTACCHGHLTRSFPLVA